MKNWKELKKIVKEETEKKREGKYYNLFFHFRTPGRGKMKNRVYQ